MEGVVWRVPSHSPSPHVSVPHLPTKEEVGFDAPPVPSPEQLLLQVAHQGGIADVGACSSVLSLLVAFRSVNQAILRLMADEEVSHGKLGTLVVLYALDPVLSSPAQLAAQVGVTRSAMTDVLDALERKGWVHRTRTGDDRRVRGVGLTDEGREHTGGVTRRFLQTIEKIGSALSLSDQSILVAECRALSHRAAELT